MSSILETTQRKIFKNIWKEFRNVLYMQKSWAYRYVTTFFFLYFAQHVNLQFPRDLRNIKQNVIEREYNDMEE